MTPVHVPILVEPIVKSLLEPFRALPAEAPAHWLVDCTLGGGGHTAAFLEAFASEPALRRHRVLSVDRDPAAVEAARQRFARELAEGRLEIHHSPFSEVQRHLHGKLVLGLMADLGFSSDQMDNPERGLSFQAEGPLDMRLNPSEGLSAREYLAQVSEKELEAVICEYGEERFSRRIAAAIVWKRRQAELPSTTRELADVVVRAIPPSARHGRIHAATRTFQALRIIVNDELKELDCLLEHGILELQRGGRVAFISFHSLEDRRVKLAFRDKDSAFEPLTKKPMEADEEEIRRNPRSRSAKLRIAVRK